MITKTSVSQSHSHSESAGLTRQSDSEPWSDGHILYLINQRDQVLHKFRKSKIADDFKHFSKLGINSDKVNEVTRTPAFCLYI